MENSSTVDESVSQWCSLLQPRGLWVLLILSFKTHPKRVRRKKIRCSTAFACQCQEVFPINMMGELDLCAIQSSGLFLEFVCTVICSSVHGDCACFVDECLNLNDFQCLNCIAWFWVTLFFLLVVDWCMSWFADRSTIGSPFVDEVFNYQNVKDGHDIIITKPLPFPYVLSITVLFHPIDVAMIVIHVLAACKLISTQYSVHPMLHRHLFLLFGFSSTSTSSFS